MISKGFLKGWRKNVWNRNFKVTSKQWSRHRPYNCALRKRTGACYTYDLSLYVASDVDILKTASARIKVSSQLNNDVNIISSIRRENILILVLALNDMLASLTCIKAYKSWFFVSFLFLLMSWFVSWRLGEDRRSQMLFFFYFSIFWNRHLFEEPKHVGAGRAYKNGRWIWSEAHRWVFNLQTGVIMRVRSWIAGKSGK